MNKKKFTSIALAGLILVGSSFNGLAAAWYDNAVSYGKEASIVPEDISVLTEIDRSYVLTSLYRLNKKTGPSQEEVKKWALDNKLIADGLDLGEKISRAELSQVIKSYADLLAMDTSVRGEDIKKAGDYKDIPKEYLDSMNFAFSAGLIQGNDKGLLNPKAPTKMAEFLQILVNLDSIADTKEEEKTITAKVTDVSKYGNVGTSATLEDFKAAGFEPGDLIRVQVKDKTIVMPYGDTYSNVDNKKEVIVPNLDEGIIVVAINMGNFSTTYDAVLDTELSFSMAEKAGYKEEYEIRNINKFRTNKREDYSSDEVFANFRSIELGRIAKGNLYRTSSPINPEIARADYADVLIKKHGVKTVMNMADSKEELEGYFAAETFNSPYYKSLYDQGQVVYLDMGVDFSADDFKEKLQKGLIFLSENEGPFAVHCNEGKDRAGFASAVLEALMGASVDEIKEDYMVTYMNYYFVEKDSERYEKIADSNIMKSLKMIADVETDEELRSVNLEEKTEEYLEKTIGLTKEQIKNLKEVLSKELVLDKAA